MSNDEASPARQKPGDGPVEKPLGAGVEPGGSLVEDDDAGVGQKSSGQGNELRFPRRQALPERTQLTIESSGSCLDPAVQSEHRKRLPDPVVGDRIVEDGDVVAKTALEQLNLLCYHCHPLP